MTSFVNEEHEVVRNSRTDIGDSARLDLLAHGRYPEGRRVYEEFQRSSAGLRCVS